MAAVVAYYISYCVSPRPQTAQASVQLDNDTWETIYTESRRQVLFNRSLDRRLLAEICQHALGRVPPAWKLGLFLDQPGQSNLRITPAALINRLARCTVQKTLF